MMKTYIGTKLINAKPMSRADYNTFRGWTLPANESGEDAGYLVEYLDGGIPNTDAYFGYVSWSPATQFDGAYVPVRGAMLGMQPHMLRLAGEKAELDDKREKLATFIAGPFFKTLPEHQQMPMYEQQLVMTEYSGILATRLRA